MTRRNWIVAVGGLASLGTACRQQAEIPGDVFPEAAAGGWRRKTLRDLPVSESPDPVPRNAVDRIVTASYEGPGTLEARVYALSSAAVGFELTQRWRPSADTVFFSQERFFVVVKWQTADRAALKLFVTDLEKRLAGGPKGGK